MLITDMRTLSMVENRGFKAMISIFHPNYELPSRIYFSKHLEDKQKEIKDKVKKALQETDSVALTMDIWTSVATEVYLGLTCHYLKNWKMVSHCLTTMPLEESHTAANIAEWTQEVIDKFHQRKSKMLSMTMVQKLWQQQIFCRKSMDGHL